MKHLSDHAARAFTLIEMLVVMGIFLVITGLVLANHSKFNSSVVLGSLAYDMALSIRQAQVYGVSVQQTPSASFQAGYGIHFSPGSTYFLFADTNNNGQYDAGEQQVSVYSVGQGHSIKRFCELNTFSQSVCSDDGDTPLSYLDIVFLRPNPDATFASNVPGYTSSAKIVVASPSGETRTITVASTGQISVSNP
ncbi:MAG: prepilin-type N-terminal cleavage/methylation domain-containing protein [Patescibacteria group bacterium]|nr:prepilin-type N-terminal cleavage/methylation domain-containing protein [Patescibacteria group bacterium]